MLKRSVTIEILFKGSSVTNFLTIHKQLNSCIKILPQVLESSVIGYLEAEKLAVIVRVVNKIKPM